MNPLRDFVASMHVLGFGTDDEISGADCVDAINAWLPYLEKAARIENAAPDLLATLQDTLTWFDNRGSIDGVHFDEQSVRDSLAAAIARAVTP